MGIQCDTLMINLQRMNAKIPYGRNVASMRLLPFDLAWDGATNFAPSDQGALNEGSCWAVPERSRRDRLPPTDVQPGLRTAPYLRRIG